MKIFLLSFLVVSLAVLGMAIGALAGRRPLKGGCGDADCAEGAEVGCGACGTGNQEGDTNGVEGFAASGEQLESS